MLDSLSSLLSLVSLALTTELIGQMLRVQTDTIHNTVQGADDDLLKVWSSGSGQLLATLRGHSAEVTDISLSFDNTMIASGSLDKSVRVWCAQSSAP